MSTMTLSPGTPLSGRNVMANGKTVNLARISLSMLAGCTSGILGLTSLWGLLFYFVASAILGLYYVVKVGQSKCVFFANRSQMTTAFVLENLFTYVLVWTLVYGCVHVY